jgi:MGT family glycosyltransferase
MSSFLFATWGFGSHVDPFLAVAKAVRKAGHDVSIYTDSEHRPEVESIGCNFLPFNELSQSSAEEIIDGVIRNRRRPWRLWQYWRQFLVDTIPLQVADLRHYLALSHADVLVSDIALWGPLAVLRETEQIPVAVLSHVGLCLEPGGTAGPVPGGAMPPRRNGLQRFRASVREALALPAARDARRRVNAIRAQYNLPPLSLRMTQMVGTMDLYLIPASASFDYGRTDLPSNVRYIGPCLYPPPAPFAAIRTAGKRIVVDEGSLFPHEQQMVRAAIDALGSHHDVTVITGKGRTNLLESTSPRVTVRAYRPVQEALGDVSLLITNGNSDSVMAGLLHGIPMVVVPSIMDQLEVALRVQEWGAGVVLEERSCTPSALASAVARVLGDPAYRQNAGRQGAELRTLSGPDLAAQHLAQLAGRSAQPQRLEALTPHFAER